MKSKRNELQQVWKILIQLLSQKGSLSTAFQMHPELSAFSKALCFGVCRYYWRLEPLAFQLLNKKRPKNKEVWAALLLGLYQLYDMQKAPYAVVQDTLNLLENRQFSWAKGLVNAVLRNFCREKEARLKSLASDPLFQYNHPLWMIKRIQDAWPKEAAAIFKANDAAPPLSLRVNLQKQSREAYIKQFDASKHEISLMPYVASGFILSPPVDVFSLPGFSRGEVSVQDESGQLVPSFLDLKAGLCILDACAAPGSKTCHILEALPPSSDLLAIELEAQRLKQLEENLKRLGLQAKLRCADASQPSSWWDGKLFDRILIDAPCSALGVIRRHPDIKLLRKEEDLDAILKTQAALLNKLWPLLKKDGLLLYTTCSLLPEENSLQIKAFLQDHPEATLLPLSLDCGKETGYGLQLLPGQNNFDGFFYALLQKTSL